MTGQPFFTALAGSGGEMGRRTREFDWGRTSVGTPSQWPQSLRTAVATLLECQLPMYLAWGTDYVQFYNDAYKPILGAKDLDALGNSAPATWQEIWDTIGPMWQQVRAGGAIGFNDFKLTIQRYGYPEDCYFNFSYSPVRDDSGQVAGVLVTFAETTNRVLSERRLRFLDDLRQATREESDPAQVMKVASSMLGSYLGASRCAYANVLGDQDTFDLLGDFNDGVPSIVGRYKFTDFGQSVQDLMVRNCPYVNHDVDTDPVTAGTDLSAYRLTRIQAVICVPLHKDGRFVAAMAVHQATARRWSDDEIELVRTVVDRCWDSLERIRADAALREEARSLEVLNRTGAALAGELDLQALLQRATDAATELTGAKFGAFFYNGKDERGEALMLYTLSGAPVEAFASFGHPRPTPLFGPTFRGDPPIRIDDVLADPRFGKWGPDHGMPAGHLPVRSYLAVPVISRAGDVIGGLFFGHAKTGVFTARSERLALGIAGQAAIAVDNARLYAQAQHLAQERNMLLESERAARLESERAGKLKDEFLATLSHELRTPLSAITGWIHIFRRKLDPSLTDLRKGVEVIDRSTKAQVQLIEDLLDMGRITSGKLALDPRPLAAASFVEAAVDVSRPAAEAAGIELVVDLAAAGTVVGHSSRLQQVVWNLLANAIKFTPRGGSVRVAVREASGVIEIVVSDNGAGIPADFLPHIFDRFRQADGSITRKFGGLGLGLSIVRHLVELHGGTVSAQSPGVGLGSTFLVSLPLHDHDGTANGASATAAEARPALLGGRRVLVVDDDPDARDLLARILGESGAHVSLASDAQGALQALDREPFDLLLSDISMPGTDGYELLRRVRAKGHSEAALPAIALTAFARAEDRARALEAGFIVHVTKPMDPSTLLNAVARVLG
jgi:signal transduction histidine kinase/PAS domain-containing protein